MTVKWIIYGDVHVHGDVAGVLDAIRNLKETMMATVQEVKDAIAAEHAQVTERIAALEARIEELLQAGAGATPEELDELRALVQGIYTPPEEPMQP